jgi:hypothetical protein
MTKEFIPYEQALELKELGFDEPCLTLITPNGTLESIDMEDWEKVSGTISAPLYQQVFRWFREKHNIIAYTKIYIIRDGVDEYHYEIKIDKIRLHMENPYSINTFKTYEESELACLKKLIEIVKAK